MTPADLQAWRVAANLRQEDLARLLEVHPLTVSQWETGRRAIPRFLHLALEALTEKRRVV